MAITINGSGTITGVSAGGLPDNSITTDDLASDLTLSGDTTVASVTETITLSQHRLHQTYQQKVQYLIVVVL